MANYLVRKIKMSKSANLFRLLYLFRARKALSLREIRTELQISRRSALRYIAELSEHTLEIRYDKSLGKYKLGKVYEIPPGYLALSEILFLRLSVTALKANLHTYHQELIKRLIEKLDSLHPLVSLEGWQIFEESCQFGGNPDDLAESIVRTMTLVAAANSYGLDILVTNGSSESRKVQVSQPGLLFREGKWLLSDNEAASETLFPITDIESFRFI